ncbi:hypothetical protein Hanom_Chr05g00473621 [Helianthus anomalus]
MNGIADMVPIEGLFSIRFYLPNEQEMKMLLQGCCVCAKPSLKTTRSLENEKLVVVPNSSDKFKVFERLCRFFTNRLQGIPPPLINY